MIKLPKYIARRYSYLKLEGAGSELEAHKIVAHEMLPMLLADLASNNKACMKSLTRGINKLDGSAFTKGLSSLITHIIIESEPYDDQKKLLVLSELDIDSVINDLQLALQGKYNFNKYHFLIESSKYSQELLSKEEENNE